MRGKLQHAWQVLTPISAPHEGHLKMVLRFRIGTCFLYLLLAMTGILRAEHPAELPLADSPSADLPSADLPSAELPTAATSQAAPCPPKWVNESTLTIDGELAVLLTHFTDRLDQHHQTKPALRRITSLAQENQWPLFYLHEGTAPHNAYFYTDCNPTGYINSSLGRFDFDSQSLRHVIVAGGFYELCMDNTFRQIVENWSGIAREEKLQITFVMDAVYGVASDSYTTDRFDNRVRAWIQQQRSHTVVMSSVLEAIQTRDDCWTFLSRRWSKIPSSFGLHVRFRDEITAVRFAEPNQPTIVLFYTTSAALAKSVDPATKRPGPLELTAGGTQRRRRQDARQDRAGIEILSFTFGRDAARGLW